MYEERFPAPVTERLAIAVGSGFNALKVLCGNRWFCRPSR
jgi:hypothetical protein